MFSDCNLNARVKSFWLLGSFSLAKARNFQEGASLFLCTNDLNDSEARHANLQQ
jgi:hypothetical protein